MSSGGPSAFVPVASGPWVSCSRGRAPVCGRWLSEEGGWSDQCRWAAGVGGGCELVGNLRGNGPWFRVRGSWQVWAERNPEPSPRRPSCPCRGSTAEAGAGDPHGPGMSPGAGRGVTDRIPPSDQGPAGPSPSLRRALGRRGPLCPSWRGFWIRNWGEGTIFFKEASRGAKPGGPGSGRRKARPCGEAPCAGDTTVPGRPVRGALALPAGRGARAGCCLPQSREESWLRAARTLQLLVA